MQSLLKGIDETHLSPQLIDPDDFICFGDPIQLVRVVVQAVDTIQFQELDFSI